MLIQIRYLSEELCIFSVCDTNNFVHSSYVIKNVVFNTIFDLAFFYVSTKRKIKITPFFT